MSRGRREKEKNGGPRDSTNLWGPIESREACDRWDSRSREGASPLSSCESTAPIPATIGTVIGCCEAMEEDEEEDDDTPEGGNIDNWYAEFRDR